MGIIVRQDDNGSKLQERIQAELQDKAKRQPQPTDDVDGVEDSQYVDGMKKTTSLAWVWVCLGVIVVVLVVWLIVLSTRA